MERLRWKKKEDKDFDCYDIIDLYKAKIITKDEARYLVSQIVKVWFPQ